MTAGAVSRRYAAALFDVVQKSGHTDRALVDLRMVAGLIGAHDELRKVFENPAIAHARKKAVLNAIIGRVGPVATEVERLLGLMADRDRLSLIGAVATAFETRVNESRRIVPAEVTTAEPLDEASRSAIAEALRRATGNDVRITERVDPAVVGGVVARVGSLVFDGSVTRQLERLRQRLAAGV